MGEVHGVGEREGEGAGGVEVGYVGELTEQSLCFEKK